MITGCPNCPHQGDGNSQAGLQAHINRVPGPTVVDAALALAADRPPVPPRVGDTITTAEQYETVRAWFFERGEYLIVRESWRPWIISEDERGNAWAWSWLEEQGPDQREGEGPGGTVVDAEALRLPLTVLHVPGEPSRPSVTDDARAEAELRAENVAAWNTTEYVEGYKYGFRRGAEWAAGRAETTTGCPLRAHIQGLADNQQTWIDAGRSGQTISRDAVRDTLRRALSEHPCRAETTTEWGVRSTDTGTPYQRHDEEDARHVAARQGWAVVRREVTAWTEADR